MNEKRLPPGRQVYDALNGLRVGAIAGLLLGAAVAALTGTAWVLAVGIVAGAAIGYLWERRQVREDLDALPPREDETE